VVWGLGCFLRMWEGGKGGGWGGEAQQGGSVLSSLEKHHDFGNAGGHGLVKHGGVLVGPPIPRGKKGVVWRRDRRFKVSRLFPFTIAKPDAAKKKLVGGDGPDFGFRGRGQGVFGSAESKKSEMGLGRDTKFFVKTKFKKKGGVFLSKEWASPLRTPDQRGERFKPENAPQKPPPPPNHQRTHPPTDLGGDTMGLQNYGKNAGVCCVKRGECWGENKDTYRKGTHQSKNCGKKKLTRRREFFGHTKNPGPFGMSLWFPDCWCMGNQSGSVKAIGNKESGD